MTLPSIGSRMEALMDHAKEATSDDSLANRLHFKRTSLHRTINRTDPPLKIMLIDRRPEILGPARHLQGLCH